MSYDFHFHVKQKLVSPSAINVSDSVIISPKSITLTLLRVRTSLDTLIHSFSHSLFSLSKLTGSLVD